ncbi:MAG: hypothetical protein ACLQNE_26690 [Thermoguttaceae bacterium]
MKGRTVLDYSAVTFRETCNERLLPTRIDCRQAADRQWLRTRIRRPLHLLPDDTIRITHYHIVELAADTVLKGHPQRSLLTMKNHIKEHLGSNKILVPNPAADRAKTLYHF